MSRSSRYTVPYFVVLLQHCTFQRHSTFQKILTAINSALYWHCQAQNLETCVGAYAVAAVLALCPTQSVLRSSLGVPGAVCRQHLSQSWWRGRFRCGWGSDNGLSHSRERKHMHTSTDIPTQKAGTESTSAYNRKEHLISSCLGTNVLVVYYCR